MKTIGITGGIGSGKSTFCTILEEYGAELFNADIVASHIMEADTSVRDQLVLLLGEKTYLKNGKLDRPFVSDLAFSDPSILTRIGEIVHPAVHLAFLEAQENARYNRRKAIVREAAIPPDGPTRATLDLVVSILADRELRIKRVVSRSDLSSAEVEARIQVQATDAEFSSVADVVIQNNKNVQALRKQAQKFWNERVLS